MNYMFKLIKGYLFSFFIFSMSTVLITLLIKFTSTPENLSGYYLITAMSLATFFLGIFSGKLIGKNGLLCAFMLSVIFVFIIIFSINCAYFKDVTWNSFDVLYLIPVIIGAIGGIIGVNVKK